MEKVMARLLQDGLQQVAEIELPESQRGSCKVVAART